jgi:hypothetical protein
MIQFGRSSHFKEEKAVAVAEMKHETSTYVAAADPAQHGLDGDSALRIHLNSI